MKVLLMKSLFVFGLLLVFWIIAAPGCMTFRKPDKIMKKSFLRDSVELITHTEVVAHRHIHYAQTGSPNLPTLVFIHGTPGSWDAFAGYMKDPDLLQHYRMISIDRPGFGYSDFGMAENLQRQSELISPVLRQLDNGLPMYFVGHSLGGPMIVKLAADNPGLCSGLIIISGSVDPAEEKPEKWRPWIFKTPLNLLVPGAFRPSNVELWYLKKDLVSLRPDFSKVHCPVLFIHGSNDTWVPPGNVEYARQLLVNAPKIETDMLPNGNHFIPWTRFNEIKGKLLQLGGAAIVKEN